MKLACDIVIFTIRYQKLHILLVQRNTDPYKGLWCLPWGFITETESCEWCAHRILFKETHIYSRHLALCGIQSDPRRDPRWRYISVVYYSIISSEDLIPQEGNNQLRAMFIPLESLPVLGFDHEEIIRKSKEKLLQDIEWSDSIKYFLPKHFSLSLLQEICEIIYWRRFEKRNFLKYTKNRFKILKTKYKEKQVAHRPAFLYKFI